jgi:ribosomal-protein-alanine N-acetyltransferase
VTEPVWLGRASAGDAPHLAALESECHTHPWTLGQFVDELDHGAPGAVLVLRALHPLDRWGDLRAYCVYRLVVDEMHILNVAVAPPCRRRGLARWILRLAMARAARAGAVRALLEVRESNEAARVLYGSLGFRPLGTRRSYYRQPSEDAVILGLELLGGGDP